MEDVVHGRGVIFEMYLIPQWDAVWSASRVRTEKEK